LENEPQAPLSRADIGKTGKLLRQPLARTDAADTLKRRLKQAGVPAHYSPHSFRVTRITNFLENLAPLKQLNASPGTPTAEPRNSMTAAARRCFWRIWKGFGIDTEKETKAHAYRF
jgi:hypothetical protein